MERWRAAAKNNVCRGSWLTSQVDPKLHHEPDDRRLCRMSCLAISCPAETGRPAFLRLPMKGHARTPQGRCCTDEQSSSIGARIRELPVLGKSLLGWSRGDWRSASRPPIGRSGHTETVPEGRPCPFECVGGTLAEAVEAPGPAPCQGAGQPSFRAVSLSCPSVLFPSKHSPSAGRRWLGLTPKSPQRRLSRPVHIPSRDVRGGDAARRPSIDCTFEIQRAVSDGQMDPAPSGVGPCFAPGFPIRRHTDRRARSPAMPSHCSGVVRLHVEIPACRRVTFGELEVHPEAFQPLHPARTWPVIWSLSSIGPSA